MTPLLRDALRVTLGVLALLGLAEAGLRAAHGGHGLLPLYTPGEPPGLAPSSEAVGLLGARPYMVRTDARGYRVPSAESGVLLVGDSLAFGLGVDGDDTLAARCTASGTPMINAAVPGYSALDALDRAAALAGPDDPVLLVLNPWDDADAPLVGRTTVVNGWLVAADAPGWIQAFFATPLSHWQVPHTLVQMVVLARRTPAPRIGFAAVGDRIRAFTATHPATRVVWGGYPSERLPDGRAVADLRAEVGVPLVDLALADAWIPGDLHWSAEGVRQVAAQVCVPSVDAVW